MSTLADQATQLLPEFRARLNSRKNDPFTKRFLQDARFSEDEFLRRFLIARKCNLDKAEDMIAQQFAWRHKKQCDSLLEKHIHGKLLSGERVGKIKKHYPHGFCGVDREGAPVYYERLGSVDAKKVLEILPEEEFVDYFLAEVELSYWHRFAVCQQYSRECLHKHDHLGETERENIIEKKALQIRKGITVLDVGGLGMNFLSKTTRGIIQQISSMMADNYPESAKAVYIVNAARVATMLWPAVRAFIDPDTAKKIRLVAKNKTLSVLEEAIDRAFIPTFLGGECSVGDCLEKTYGPWTEDFRQRYGMSELPVSSAFHRRFRDGRGSKDSNSNTGSQNAHTLQDKAVHPQMCGRVRNNFKLGDNYGNDEQGNSDDEGNYPGTVGSSHISLVPTDPVLGSPDPSPTEPLRPHDVAITIPEESFPELPHRSSRDSNGSAGTVSNGRGNSDSRSNANQSHSFSGSLTHLAGNVSLGLGNMSMSMSKMVSNKTHRPRGRARSKSSTVDESGKFSSVPAKSPTQPAKSPTQPAASPTQPATATVIVSTVQDAAEAGDCALANDVKSIDSPRQDMSTRNHENEGEYDYHGSRNEQLSRSKESECQGQAVKTAPQVSSVGGKLKDNIQDKLKDYQANQQLQKNSLYAEMDETPCTDDGTDAVQTTKVKSKPAFIAMGKQPSFIQRLLCCCRRR